MNFTLVYINLPFFGPFLKQIFYYKTHYYLCCQLYAAIIIGLIHILIHS